MVVAEKLTVGFAPPGGSCQEASPTLATTHKLGAPPHVPGTQRMVLAWTQSGNLFVFSSNTVHSESGCHLSHPQQGGGRGRARRMHWAAKTRRGPPGPPVRAGSCPRSCADRSFGSCREGGCGTTLEATQRQMDGFFSQLPYKCHHNRVASVGD